MLQIEAEAHLADTDDVTIGDDDRLCDRHSIESRPITALAIFQPPLTTAHSDDGVLRTGKRVVYRNGIGGRASQTRERQQWIRLTSYSVLAIDFVQKRETTISAAAGFSLCCGAAIVSPQKHKQYNQHGDQQRAGDQSQEKKHKFGTHAASLQINRSVRPCLRIGRVLVFKVDQASFADLDDIAGLQAVFADIHIVHESA